MVEVSRNLQENFGVTEQQTAYRESEIRKHFAEAWVEGYEGLIPAMTNHPKTVTFWRQRYARMRK